MLIQRILNCISTDEAVKVVEEYKVSENKKVPKKSDSLMEFEENPLTEEEEMKVKMIRDKRIREKKRVFQEKGIEGTSNDNRASTQQPPPPQYFKWWYCRQRLL